MTPSGRLTSLTVCFLVAVAALAATMALAPSAHAADGFKFWGYYHLSSGEWQASQKGPQGFTAPDGAVEGFRFASTTATTPERPPRALPAFDDICGGTAATGTEKRVALVLDFGTAQDAVGDDVPPAPEAACAVVAKEATTQQALESVKPLRVEGGLLCAIDGYPSSGCAEEVTDVTVPATEESVDLALPGEEQPTETEGTGTPWAVVGIGAVVVVLGGGAFVLARRRA